MLKPLRICFRCLYGLAFWAFLVGLFLCLLLQIYIAASLARNGHVRIPDAFVEKVIETATSDFWLQHEGVFLNFGGVLIVRSAEVGVEGIRSPLLVAERAVIDIDALLLLAARLELDRFSVDEARLQIPAIYSPTGVDEELFSLRGLEIREAGDVYEIGRGLFRFGELEGLMSGQFSLPAGALKGEESEGGESFRDMLEPALEDFFKAKQSVAQVGDPLLMLDFQSEGKGINRLEARAFSRGVFLPDAKVETGPLDVVLAAHFSRTTLEAADLSIEVRDVAWKDAWKVAVIDGHKSVRGPVTLNNLADGIEITAQGISGPGLLDPVDFARVQPRINNILEVPLEIDARWGNSQVSAFARLSPFLQEASIQAEVRKLSVEQLDTIEAVRTTGLSTLLWGLDSSRFLINTRVGFDGKWERVDILGDTGPVAYKGVWLDNVWGEISLYPDRVELPDFAMYGPVGDASGSLDFAFATRDLEIYLDSRITPTSINPWMLDWWVNLWKPFTFNEFPRAQANFYIDTTIGKWRSTSFFGSVSAESTAYKGAIFDRGSTKVWGKPRFTEVYDLQVSRPEGDTAGRLSWTFFPDRRGLQLNEYALKGIVDLRNGERIFPAGVQAITERFEPEGPIDLDVEGIFYGRDSRPYERIREAGGVIVAKTSEPIEAYGMALDDLEVVAAYDSKGVRVDSLKLSAGGGTVTGAFAVDSVRNEEGEVQSQLNLDLAMQQLRRDRVFTVFPMLKSEDSIPLEEDGGDVRIDLAVAAVGDPNDLFSFEGSGNFSMTGTNLNDINLFGGLSESLANTAFPVGNMGLNRVESPVLISGSLLEFEDVKGSGRGVTLRGAGTYEMERDHTNFKLKLQPGNLEETPIYSLLTAVFRPVTSAFPIRLWGPLANPNWALDLFASESQYSEPEEELPPNAGDTIEPENANLPVEEIPAGDPLPDVDLGNRGAAPPILE